ncbi:hypothetical protein VE04_00883 [Pseudogymnoascus sp. 24MN13]|nr:hypothetical protein VE04_00883 [Pseudogymnoascus sp. 24MN13]
MAGSTISGEPGSSPQSSKTPGTRNNNTKSVQDAEEEAMERRKKAAAKALAEQSRLRAKSSQKSTSLAKNSKLPEDSLEPRNISPTKSPRTSHSGFDAVPTGPVDLHAAPSSTSQPSILPTACQGDKALLEGTSSTNNSSQATHTDPTTNSAESTVTAATPAPEPQATDLPPKKLSPNNYAKRDARFEVQVLSTKDETIKRDDPSYTSKQMFLEWDGIDREALKVVNGDRECLLVEFSTIQRISYNPISQRLQLIFNSTAQDEAQTVVIAMNALPREEWVQLQQLFRQVERKWRVRCDQEEMSFFDNAIKSMRKKPYRKMETPYVDRSNASGQKIAEKLTQAPRRQSVPKASRRQSVGPTLSTAAKIAKTPKNRVERPKAHLSVEVKNIMAAKVIDQPLQIPRLSTPSKPPSVTSSLLSRTSQSPLKEGAESQRNISRGYGNRDSPTKHGTGTQNRSQVPQSSAILKRDISPHGLSSLFGSDDSEHDFSGFEQPDRTPSQRFKYRMNEAKKISSSQPNESPKISPGLFAQSLASTLRDRSTQEPEEPEHGFEAFMDSIQRSNQIENVLISSSPNIRHKRNRSPSSPKLPQLLNSPPVKLVAKGLQNADSMAESDRPPKKLKESHVASENETRFYYQCKSGQDFLLPVAVDDTVIRLRTKKEMEESGKQSKYDVFDGPWTVLGISETSFPLSPDFFDLEEEDSDSTVSRQAKWDKMLTTRIKLNFPEGSEANQWVELSRLLPAIDPSYIVTGTPIPSSLEVSTHASYLGLVDRLRIQPLAPGSHNSFVKKVSSATVGELHVVEIRKGKFVVFVDIDHKAIGDSYEVAKIRQKRLRLYTKAEAKQIEATQYDDDKWVKRLLMQHGDIARNKIIVDEYLCSWAGWAVEDQTWVPRGNFGNDELLRLFDDQNDPFRDILGDIVLPVESLVHEDDLEKARASLRKTKPPGSSCQSSRASARRTITKRGTARRSTR